MDDFDPILGPVLENQTVELLEMPGARCERIDGVVDVRFPLLQTSPFVFDSPHSGSNYSEVFVAQSKLDLASLRGSEDSFVDELFADAPRLGAPLQRALFPRALVDPNRDRLELDPHMFRDPLPFQLKARSPRVAGGLGTIPRVVADGLEIYQEKLATEDAEYRLATYYDPFHISLAGLMEETHQRFGSAVLIDCHSMPSISGASVLGRETVRADVVLGNGFGTTCSPVLIEFAEKVLTDLGYRVARNSPYAGGYITLHYGQPSLGLHSMQIEINRALYMDEKSIERHDGFYQVQAAMAALMSEMMALDSSLFLPSLS